MTDKKTRLYLDVDGVVNYFGWHYLANHPKGFVHPWPTHKQERINGYTITWSPDMLSALDDLDLEVVWLTTWRDEAVNSLAPGIEWGADFRVIHPLEEDTWKFRAVSSINWKFPALLADQENDPSPFIWAEDESRGYHSEMRRLFGDRALVVTPDEFIGISPEDIERMRLFQVNNGQLTG